MRRISSFIKEWKKNKLLFIMVVPAMLYFLVISYIPMSGIYLAFTNYNFRDGFLKSPFVGFTNFKFLFNGGIAFTITRNTVLYNIAFIIFGSITSILAAIILSEIKGKYFKKITQSIMFLPYFISFVMVAAFVYNIFNFEYGALNGVLKSLGMNAVNVYDEVGAWKYIIVLLHIWKQLGYGTVIYLAAILAVDESINEAACIDGANIFQRIRYITIPHIKPTFFIILIFNVGSIMRGQFDLFYNVIGSNGILFNATDIIDTYVYRSLMVSFNIGMASAAGVYQSVFGLVIVLIVNALIKKYEPEYALF